VYYGDTCDQANACLLTTSPPCFNGGTCHNTSHLNFTCQCLPGYYGLRCDAGFNPCAVTPDPCLNSGTCYNTSTGSGFMCTCAINPEVVFNRKWIRLRLPGQTGSGYSTESGFVCACPAGYYGERCASFDPCSRQPCLNGAGCRNLTSLPPCYTQRRTLGQRCYRLETKVVVLASVFRKVLVISLGT